MRRPMTCDQGREMAQHKGITATLAALLGKDFQQASPRAAPPLKEVLASATAGLH